MMTTTTTTTIMILMDRDSHKRAKTTVTSESPPISEQGCFAFAFRWHNPKHGQFSDGFRGYCTCPGLPTTFYLTCVSFRTSLEISGDPEDFHILLAVNEQSCAHQCPRNQTKPLSSMPLHGRFVDEYLGATPCGTSTWGVIQTPIANISYRSMFDFSTECFRVGQEIRIISYNQLHATNTNL